MLAADRGEPFRFDAHAVSLLVREATASALMVLLWPFGLGHRSPSIEPGAARVPVLLVPGYRANRSWMLFLRIYLRSRGFNALHTVNHRALDRSLADLAADLAHEVETLKRQAGVEQVDLVGHSMGGLVSAWYVRHLDGARSVRRLVTIGTPWHGTRMAVFGRHRVAEDLRVGSHVLDDLSPPPVPTIAIWSPDDPQIVPSQSALPEGAESVRVDGAGHTEMLVSGRVFRAVEAALAPPAVAGATA